MNKSDFWHSFKCYSSVNFRLNGNSLHVDDVFWLNKK